MTDLFLNETVKGTNKISHNRGRSNSGNVMLYSVSATEFSYKLNNTDKKFTYGVLVVTPG